MTPSRLFVLARRLSFAAILAALFAGALGVPAKADPHYPALEGRVTDAAHVLSPAAKERIAGTLKAYEDATQHQFIVVTVTSLEGEDITDYPFHLAREWKIGRKDEDDGVILFFAIKERKVRFEVGRGAETFLTDIAAKHIITDVIAPAARPDAQGRTDWDRAVEAGVNAAIQEMNHEEGRTGAAAPTAQHAAAAQQSAPLTPGQLILIIIGICVFIGFGIRYPILFQIVIGALLSGGSSSSGGGGGFSGRGGDFGGGGADDEV